MTCYILKETGGSRKSITKALRSMKITFLSCNCEYMKNVSVGLEHMAKTLS